MVQTLIQTCSASCTSGQCTSTPLCTTNTDCGTDGVVGPLMCSNNAVVKTIQTFTCNSPGTSQAFCSSSNSTQTQQVCSDFCSQGVCQTFTCNNNNDCNDNNPATQDVCQNPSTLNSICTHTTIQCSSNIDCGSTSTVSFCTQNNITQNTTTYLCNNPGDSSSFCTNTTIQTITQTCDSECSGGVCRSQLHDIAILNLSLPTTLTCNNDYNLSSLIINKGNFTENISLVFSLGSLQSNTTILNLAPTSSQTTALSQNITLNTGSYLLTLNALIANDSNASDNTASLLVNVLCTNTTQQNQTQPPHTSGGSSSGSSNYRRNFTQYQYLDTAPIYTEQPQNNSVIQLNPTVQLEESSSIPWIPVMLVLGIVLLVVLIIILI